jgi:hypothetical protein
MTNQNDRRLEALETAYDAGYLLTCSKELQASRLQCDESETTEYLKNYFKNAHGLCVDAGCTDIEIGTAILNGMDCTGDIF